MIARRRAGSLWLVVIVLVLGLAAPAATVAGVPEVTLFLRMGDCTITGAADPDIALRVIVRAKDGHRLLRKDLTVSSSGDWNAGCLDRPVAAGQQVVFRSDGSLVRLVVIQRLTVRADRTADVLTGHAPVSGQLRVIVNRCLGAGAACTAEEALDEPVAVDPPTGTWSLPTAPHDLQGGDGLIVSWTSAAGDTFFTNQGVPYVDVRAGSSGVSGRGPSGATMRVESRTAAGALRGSASAPVPYPYGGWTAVLRKNGSAVPVKVGDRIAITGETGPLLRVRQFELQIDRPGASASGTCFPDGEFGVRTLAGPTPANLAGGVAGPDGSWEVTGLDGMESGWTFTLWCANTQGDLVRTVRPVP